MQTDVLLQPRFAFEDYQALRDDPNRYEVLRGEVFMSPPPTINHEIVVGNIADALKAHFRTHPFGRVWAGRFALSFPDELDGWVEPDLVVVRAGRDLRNASDTRFEGVPDVVVEVQSPSTAHYDAIEKKQRYATAGVPEYWLVSLKDRSVTVLWKPHGGIYEGHMRYGAGETLVSSVIESFSMPVDAVFGDVRWDRVL